MFRITIDYKKDSIDNILDTVYGDANEIAELIGENYDDSIVRTGLDAHYQKMCRAGELLHIVDGHNDRSLQITLEDDAVKDFIILFAKAAKVFAPFYNTLKYVVTHLKSAADRIERLAREYEYRWGEDPAKNRYAIVAFTIASEKVAVLCKSDEFDQRSIVGVRCRSEFESAARFMVKTHLTQMDQKDFYLTEKEAHDDMWGFEFPAKALIIE